jgi:hypothetical protein
MFWEPVWLPAFAGMTNPATNGTQLPSVHPAKAGIQLLRCLSTAPLNRVSEIPLSARHSREGGNPDVVGKPLDPRLRGGDGTTNWALHSVEAYLGATALAGVTVRDDLCDSLSGPLSPRPRISVSPHPRVSVSPRPRVRPSPCPRISASPRLPLPASALPRVTPYFSRAFLISSTVGISWSPGITVMSEEIR